jgi:hypothetical protein
LRYRKDERRLPQCILTSRHSREMAKMARFPVKWLDFARKPRIGILKRF